MSNTDVGTCLVHYRDNSAACHPAVCVNPASQTSTSDILQLDAVSLGVVVPLHRGSIDIDLTGALGNHWHPIYYCSD